MPDKEKAREYAEDFMMFLSENHEKLEIEKLPEEIEKLHNRDSELSESGRIFEALTIIFRRMAPGISFMLRAESIIVEDQEKYNLFGNSQDTQYYINRFNITITPRRNPDLIDETNRIYKDLIRYLKHPKINITKFIYHGNYDPDVLLFPECSPLSLDLIKFELNFIGLKQNVLIIEKRIETQSTPKHMTELNLIVSVDDAYLKSQGIDTGHPYLKNAIYALLEGYIGEFNLLQLVPDFQIIASDVEDSSFKPIRKFRSHMLRYMQKSSICSNCGVSENNAKLIKKIIDQDRYYHVINLCVSCKLISDIKWY